jgi:hypothetical protein
MLVTSIFLVISPLFGQVDKLEDAAVFGPEAVHLDFASEPGLSPAVGTPAGRFFDAWGIQIESLAGGPPTVEWVDLSSALTPPSIKVLSNSVNGSSAGTPMVLNFLRPVRRIGFTLGNGGDGVQAELAAFDQVGNSLGSVSGDVGPFSAVETNFLGLETSNPEGLSKVTLDYGDSENAEQLSSLVVEFLSKPLFRVHLAQVGKGRLPRGGLLRTTISIVNLANTTAEGELRLIDGGGASATPVPGQSVKRIDFRIGAFRSANFSTDSVNLDFYSGYAVVESDRPVTATATYSALAADGSTLSQAGVGAELARSFVVGPVHNRIQRAAVGGAPTLDPLESAIAIANLSGEVITVDVRLLDARPVESLAPERLLLATFDLPPHAHIARFLSQLFEVIEGEDFIGSFVVSTTGPVAVTILNTIDGLPRSSLPVGSTQR